MESHAPAKSDSRPYIYRCGLLPESRSCGGFGSPVSYAVAYAVCAYASLGVMRQVQIKFKDEEFEAIDRVRGDVPRERWIRNVCEEAVARMDAVRPAGPSQDPMPEVELLISAAGARIVAASELVESVPAALEDDNREDWER